MTWSPIDFRGKRVLLLETSREVAATLASYGAVAQHVSQSWRASQATHHLHKDFAGGASVYMPVAGYLQAASCGSYDSVLVGEEFSGSLSAATREAALRVLVFGGQLFLQINGGWELAATKEPGFLISSYPRCGTHMLLTALDRHSQLTTYGEVFNKDSDNGGHKLASAAAVLEAFWRTPRHGVAAHAYIGVSGSSGAPGMVSDGRFQDFWGALPLNLKVISLRRKDLQARHLSHRKAKRTRTWNSFGPAHQPEPAPVALPSNPLLLEKDKKFVRRCWAHVDDLHPARLVVWYEDLCENWDREQRRIQEYLGVPYESVQPTSKKLS